MGMWAHPARGRFAQWLGVIIGVSMATPCFALGLAAEQEFSTSLLILSTLPLPSGAAVLGSLRGASEKIGTVDGRVPEQPGFSTVWRSPSLKGLSLNLELNANSRLVRSYLAPPEFSLARLPGFAPEPLALQRLSLDFDAGQATTVRLGTQDLNSEPGGWGAVNMMPPTVPWGGVSVRNTLIPRTTLYGAHVSRVMDAWGTLTATQLDTLRATLQWTPGHQVMGYGYAAQTQGEASLFADSRQTLGLRADGLVPVRGSLGVRYLGEMAWQSAASAEQAQTTGTFRRAAAGVAWRGGFARADFEAADATALTRGFHVPLGTNAMIGSWPMITAAMAPQGIRVAGATLGGMYGESRWNVQLRNYRTESDAARFGSEFSVGWLHWVSKNLNWRIDYADIRWNSELAPAMRRAMFAISYQRRP